MKYRNTWILLSLGLLSGLISGSEMASFDGGFYLAPGMVFGVMFLLVFLLLPNALIRRSRLSFLSLALWIPASFVSFVVAFFLSMLIGLSLDPRTGVIITILAFAPGALVGGFLMLLAFHYLLYNLGRRKILILTLLSGLLSLAFLVDDIIPLINIGIVTWQAGMAAALGYVLDKNELAVGGKTGKGGRPGSPPKKRS